MSSTATVTATIGPGLTATAAVLTNVTAVNFDFIGGSVQIFCEQGQPIYSLTGSNTITLTVSGGNYTLTIS